MNKLCYLNATKDWIIIGYDSLNKVWLRRDKAMLLLQQLPELIAQMPVNVDEPVGNPEKEQV